MSIWKAMHKHTKQSIAETESTYMSSIFTDTVCTAVGGAIAWQTIYTTMENENPEVRDIWPTADSTKPSGVQFRDVACSFLHRIAARDRLLPYTVMIRWVVENTKVEDRLIKAAKNTVLGSFRAEDLQQMYKLLDA